MEKQLFKVKYNSRTGKMERIRISNGEKMDIIKKVKTVKHSPEYRNLEDSKYD